jgi:MSHA biogenesis protein MshI
MFVVAANNQVVREVLALGDALHWTVPVIDVQETAQRNLQSALAKQQGRLERADAALLISDERQAVLTISANEELFFTRRLDLPQGFMSMSWGSNHSDAQAVADAFTPVEEYVPDYAVGGVSHGADYSGGSSAAGSGAQGDDERVQRFLVEVQRSLDLWDRTWSSMPLSGLRVYAGDRSSELATWLGREMGQSVGAMDLNAQFPGLQDVPAADQLYALPLLGVLLRTENRKL